jgi:nucleotide-binding universal stress UspA family protein
MKIVSTVDFSIASEDILKQTKNYAKLLDAEVFLVHAEPKKKAEDEESSDNTPEAVRLRKDAQALERAGVRVTPVFLEGPVCEAIVKEAVKLDADLIVTGAHGHGGPHCKVPVGHVSECLLLKAKIPVLVIPTT